jgi:hypothetical protein
MSLLKGGGTATLVDSVGVEKVMFPAGIAFFAAGHATGIQAPRVPYTFALDQSYPNPFNPTTMITWQLSAVSSVELAVYDMLGREVAVLVRGVQQPGAYHTEFNGTRLASGVYVYRLSAGSYVSSRKMLLVR